MAKQDLPTTEELHKLFRADTESGRLWWRERTPDMFKGGVYATSRVCSTWNTKNAGCEAFVNTSMYGYKRGTIFGRQYVAHRVIWALHYGGWPKDQIDHINHDRADNRIENLRVVTNRGNSKNRRISPLNTSGATGVEWHKAANKWVAKIRTNKGCKHLGCFNLFKDAVASRKAAEEKYGYHKNHGR